jgi:hypothetical protein
MPSVTHVANNHTVRVAYYTAVAPQTATRSFRVGIDAARNHIKRVRLQAAGLCPGTKTWPLGPGRVCGQWQGTSNGHPPPLFFAAISLGGGIFYFPLEFGTDDTGHLRPGWTPENFLQPRCAAASDVIEPSVPPGPRAARSDPCRVVDTSLFLKIHTSHGHLSRCRLSTSVLAWPGRLFLQDGLG